MKQIWMRMGVTVNVTDKQFEQLKEMSRCERSPELFDEIEAPDWLLNMVDEMGEQDGDSYIPPFQFEEV